MQGTLIGGGLALGMVVGCASTPPPEPPRWAVTEEPVATAARSEPPPQPAATAFVPKEAPGPPATLDELIERGLSAIRAGNADEYMALFITSDVARQQCPELAQLSAERAREAYDSTSQRIAECSQLLDWSKAHEVRRVVSNAETATNFCHGKFHELKDSYVFFEESGLHVSVKLDDPVHIGRIYLFADNPRCRQVETPP
jgi:hypothetical protein